MRPRPSLQRYESSLKWKSFPPKVGGDEHGEAYKANLVQQKVNIKHLGVEKDVSTGIATILVEASTGENMIVIVPGANARLSEKDANAAVDDIKR